MFGGGREETYVTNRGWLMNLMGPGLIAQKVARGGHFYPQGLRRGGEVGRYRKGSGEGKGGPSCPMAFIFSLAEEAKSLGLERGVCVCM